MYLHIGKDISVNGNSIIGIFDIDSLKKTKVYKNLFENIKENIIDISEGNNKTLILTKEKQVVKAYISNILSVTLEKRIVESIY